MNYVKRKVYAFFCYLLILTSCWLLFPRKKYQQELPATEEVKATGLKISTDKALVKYRYRSDTLKHFISPYNAYYFYLPANNPFHYRRHIIMMYR